MSLTLRRKSAARTFLGLSLVALVALVALGAVFHSQLGPAQPGNNEEILFTVKNGSSAAAIAQQLEQEGLIKNAQAFLLYARISGDLNSFKAGQYLLKASSTAQEIMDVLIKGKVVTVSFTIPEGFTLKQIVKTLADKGITTEEEFWRVVKETDFPYEFLKDLPKTETRLEGFLFPDTYIIPKGWETEKVIDLMLKRFAQVYAELPPNKSGLSMYETVILASIVEAESKLDEERPKIASVFLNRLKIKMPLQADATLQYAFKERKERVLYKDLELDSPYNTYKYGGLPPGPIGSPGKASLEAVCQPAETKYYYFVAWRDGSGRHEFTETLAQHNAKKRELGY